MASSRDWWRDPSSRIRASNAMTSGLLAVGGCSEHPLCAAVRSHMFATGEATTKPAVCALGTPRMPKSEQPRLVVGISGASGIVYGLRALDACRDLGVETHLVMSRAAALTLSQETGLSVADVAAKASVVHKVSDIGAAIASGSFRTLGMIVAPCSVRTMSEIATGVTSSLLTRAADVALKERRPL